MADDDCEDGAACDTVGNRCLRRECTVREDCKARNSSPTVECVSGKCVDEVWGCIGEPDDRPTPKMQAGTLQVILIDGVSRSPVVGATIRACGVPPYDPCTKPLNGSASLYDTTSGLATFTGLPLGNGPGLRIALDPPTSSQLIPMDFYSQKPVRDVTVASSPAVTVTRDVSDAVGLAYDPPIVISSTLAGATVMMFDCKDRPAAGVKLELANEIDRLPDTRITYFGANLLPDPGRTTTDTPGVASILNLKADKVVTLATSVNGTRISEFVVTFASGRITNVHLFPRNYMMQ
jgi:hypothetical protein